MHILNTLCLKYTSQRVRNMPTCPKCGARVTEAMNFCANCGANLKPSPPPVEVAPAPPPAPAPMPRREEKHEKQEKGEKREKGEKGEKYEKRQYGFAGPIIAGVILIVLGLFFYLTMIMNVPSGQIAAYFFIVIGIAIIIAVILGASMATRRHPST